MVPHILKCVSPPLSLTRSLSLKSIIKKNTFKHSNSLNTSAQPIPCTVDKSEMSRSVSTLNRVQGHATCGQRL